MKDLDGGCCGHPQSCAGTTSTGRCKAREDFEHAQKPKPRRRSFEAFFGGDEKAIAEARETQRKRAEKNRNRSRDHDLGRTR